MNTSRACVLITLFSLGNTRLVQKIEEAHNDKACIKMSYTGEINRNSERRERGQRLQRENREEGKQSDYEKKPILLNHGERIREVEKAADIL